jgi:hypothetical protein
MPALYWYLYGFVYIEKNHASEVFQNEDGRAGVKISDCGSEYGYGKQ